MVAPRACHKNPRPNRSAGFHAIAIAAGFALLTGGALAAVPDDPVPLFAPSRAAIASPDPAISAAVDTALRNRIDDPAGPTVGGQRLRVDLLRRFYAAHNFAPVWERRPTQAEALLHAVWRAGEHGLDPDLFHVSLLRNAAALTPIDRELLLSSAFLSYADALARGALPIERRLDDEDLSPEPVDVATALTQAIDSPNPAAAIEALAPRSATYMALRQALQSNRAGRDEARARLAAGGVAPSPATSDKSAEARRRDIEVNLERQRWLPRQLPADRVWVNTATAQLVLYRSDRPVFTTRVIVGEVDKQTPELQTTITSLLFNPPWNVPQSIAAKEILPRLARDPEYLTRQRMVMRANGAIQQLPGAGTALGLLKFEMANRFDVYLHDTPKKSLFNRENRLQSHGCVRVQNPRELGALLLDQPVEVINKGIAQGSTNRRNLPTPIPVFIVYQTAFLDADGQLAFSPDVYGRDDEIWRQLDRARQAPVAQHEPASERRS